MPFWIRTIRFPNKFALSKRFSGFNHFLASSLYLSNVLNIVLTVAFRSL
jgi:hypothetical protein